MVVRDIDEWDDNLAREFGWIKKEEVLEIIDEYLDTLNKRKYSDNLKEHFEFGKGVLIALKKKINNRRGR